MEFLEYNKREIQTHLLSLIFVSSLKLYYKGMLFVFFILLKIKKVVNWCITIELLLFSFPLAMGHATFTTLADRAVHVLGQFQYLTQICKLLHGECIVVNAKVGEEQTGFLFFGAALIVHGFL